MSVLEARGIGVAFAASLPVFEGASFTLEPGWVGLVGANGAGKTTLLRVLSGDLAPQEGDVVVRPKGALIVSCPQEVTSANPDIEMLANADDGLSAELKGRLALDGLERWSTLSPGERKRWQIGAALAREPDVLLLDEPTNHLDDDARRRLLSALGRFRGIGVVVSHDRSVLEHLPRTILRVHAGAVTSYAGNYSAARAAWEHDRAAAEEAHHAARAGVKAIERKLDAARRTQAATEQSKSTRNRMKGPKDHDAKDMMRKTLVSWADARASRSVATVRDSLERAKADVPRIEKDRTVGGELFASYARAPRDPLFHVDSAEVCAGDHVVLRDVRLSIGREDRVRLAGPNGAGKTTLLNAFLTQLRPETRGRVLFLPQELSSESVEELFRDLRGRTDDERGRILSVFAALGSDPERLLARGASHRGLSPGEARKLALASGLGLHAWALVLDEPTNHLDLPTIERLERALGSFPGCLVLVTHDDAFARALTTRTIDVADFRHGADVGV